MANNKGRLVGRGRFATVVSLEKKDVSPKSLRDAIPRSVCAHDHVAVRVLNPDSDQAEMEGFRLVMSVMSGMPNDDSGATSSSTSSTKHSATMNMYGMSSRTPVVLPWAIAGRKAVMPLAREDLASFLERGQKVVARGGTLRKFLRDAIRGVVELHRAGIVHGDVRMENILLFSRKRGGISDFGSASAVGTVTKRAPTCPEHFVSKASYVAGSGPTAVPAVVRAMESVAPSARSWSRSKRTKSSFEEDAFCVAAVVVRSLDTCGQLDEFRSAAPAAWKKVCELLHPVPSKRGTLETLLKVLETKTKA